MLPNAVDILPLNRIPLSPVMKRLQSYCSALLAIESVVCVCVCVFFNPDYLKLVVPLH